MRIAIIGPNAPIPPTCWGAVESLIWDYKCYFEKLGCTILIVHQQDNGLIVPRINAFKPDVIHIHYDDFWYLWDHFECKNIIITNHFAYLEHPQLRKHEHLNGIAQSQAYIHCLSKGIQDVYVKDFHVPLGRTFILQNGANESLFRFTREPLYNDRSIYLAKIDYRKRQYIYQNIDFIDFVGNLADGRFQPMRPNYKGEWTKTHLYEHLTDYANLVLLSDGEAHPLVCCEALVCGLGLVISEFAAANLDRSLPWIDVIPTDKLDDLEYVSQVIRENQIKSAVYREKIREYGLQHFSWSVVIQRYLDTIQKFFRL